MDKQELIGGVAVIEKDGKHLLTRQSFNKPDGGLWRYPGGKFEPGESPEEGILREVKEETGLKIKLSAREPAEIMPSDYDEGNFGFFPGRYPGR